MEAAIIEENELLALRLDALDEAEMHAERAPNPMWSLLMRSDSRAPAAFSPVVDAVVPDFGGASHGCHCSHAMSWRAILLLRCMLTMRFAGADDAVPKRAREEGVDVQLQPRRVKRSRSKLAAPRCGHIPCADASQLAADVVESSSSAFSPARPCDDAVVPSLELRAYLVAMQPRFAAASRRVWRQCPARSELLATPWGDGRLCT